MLNIKLSKLLIFGVVYVGVFLLSSSLILGGYPAPCGPGPGVQVGDYCYDCSTVPDDVCPNDFVAGTCDAEPDVDCVRQEACDIRIEETCEWSSECTWCSACSGPQPSKSYIGYPNGECIDNRVKTCGYYDCTSGECGAECNDGESGSENCGTPTQTSCSIRSWSCGSNCVKIYGVCSDWGGCSYTSNCDAGSGTNPCGVSCARTISAPYTSSGNEASVGNGCNDGVDNDCDGDKDWDTHAHRGPEKGDNNCALEVKTIAVSDSNPVSPNAISVSCTSSVAGVNSISAKIDGCAECACSFIKWVGDVAQFSCTTGSAGSKTVRCYVDETKSYKVGADKTISISVRPSTCAGYSSSSSCGSDSRCEWCEKCYPNPVSGPYYNQLTMSKCVDKTTCKQVCYKDQCGAECDETRGGCGYTSRCDGNVYQTRYGSCTSSCQCSYTLWVSSCDKAKCSGAQCNDGETRNDGPYCGSDGNIYDKIFGCGLSCLWDDASVVDPKVQSCVDSCSDSDGGKDYLVKGTVMDKGKCTSTSGISCPSSSSPDSCLDSSTLREYYCNGVDASYEDVNCKQSFLGLGCSCSVSEKYLIEKCDDYDCIVGSGKCGVVGKKTIASFESDGSCKRQACRGSQYYSYRTNAGKLTWGVFAEPSESACRDWFDNDCDGESDYDSKDTRHGDDNCKMGVTKAVLSKYTIVSGSSIDITCTVSPVVSEGVNSIFAYLDNNKNGIYDLGDSDFGWDGDDGWSSDWSQVIFRKEVISGVGEKQINCGVYSSSTEPYDRSYQEGDDAGAGSLTVVSSVCSERPKSDCGKVGDCKWIDECRGFSPEYSGDVGRCVPSSQLILYSCSVLQCGEECDGSTLANCKNTERCKDRVYQLWDPKCSDLCRCDYTLIEEKCDKNECNAQCNDGETRNDGPYCGSDGNIYDKIFGCGLSCLWDDASVVDPKVQSCVDSCSDSDGGKDYLVKGTVMDKGKCTSTSGISCPFESKDDECKIILGFSTNTLKEAYCEGNNLNIFEKDCNDYDNVNVNAGANTCSWSDGSCGDGKCNVVSNSVDCSVYRDADGGDGVIKESLTTEGKCKKGCAGQDCCEITSYTANGDCSSASVGGTSYIDYHTNLGSNVWGVSAETKEEACGDGFDNDCDGVRDCKDGDCWNVRDGEGNLIGAGPGGVICCNSGIREHCPEDGAEGFVGCVNDNIKKGKVASFVCESNVCQASTIYTEKECGAGCCYPSGGAICVGPGRGDLDAEPPILSSMIDVDGDGKKEICAASSPGNWIGANCVGSSCVDDPNEPGDYNCADVSDCDASTGECGENICAGYRCGTQAKSNAQELCESLISGRGYECAYYMGCVKAGSAESEWDCEFGGDPTMCSNYDYACGGLPDYKCENICIKPEVSSNPCCLCYSQCVEAANDPSKSPGSSSGGDCPIFEDCSLCKKYGYWVNTKCTYCDPKPGCQIWESCECEDCTGKSSPECVS